MTHSFLAMAAQSTRRKPAKARAKTVFFYGGSEMDESPYEIEIGDEVEFQGDGEWGAATHLGEIIAIQPRNCAAKVSYLDETDWNAKGEPKRKSAVVPVVSLTLIRRVM